MKSVQENVGKLVKKIHQDPFALAKRLYQAIRGSDLEDIFLFMAQLVIVIGLFKFAKVLLLIAAIIFLGPKVVSWFEKKKTIQITQNNENVADG